MCNCNINVHRVTQITTGTTVNLSVTNSTNIGNLQPFQLLISQRKSLTIPASPLPVTITVNNVAIPLLNQNGIQILSNKIPLYSYGKYVSETITTTQGENETTTFAITPPYVILYDTPN